MIQQEVSDRFLSSRATHKISQGLGCIHAENQPLPPPDTVTTIFFQQCLLKPCRSVPRRPSPKKTPCHPWIGHIGLFTYGLPLCKWPLESVPLAPRILILPPAGAHLLACKLKVSTPERNSAITSLLKQIVCILLWQFATWTLPLERTSSVHQSLFGIKKI